MTKTSSIENSIQIWEDLSSLSITVHDLSGEIWPYLSPERMQHTSPICRAIKLGGFDDRCIQLEVTELRLDLSRIADGRIHICHAGLVEWIAPVWRGQTIIAILFAGQRIAGSTLGEFHHDNPPSNARRALRIHTSLPIVEREDVTHLLESVLQLAARLTQILNNRSDAPLLPGDARHTQRRLAIEQYLQRNYAAPIGIHDLATHLNLSTSRTAHVIRDCFDCTLHDLLRKQRIRVAASLLRSTLLPVNEIALRCGIGDVSHFHRAFKQALGITPAVYRRIRDEA